MTAAAARRRQAGGRLSARDHRRAGHHALRRAQGQIVGILGTNGAGKTTLLRAISGFHGIDDARVTEGTIRFKGQAHRERRAAPDRAARHRAGAGAREGVPQSDGGREPAGAGRPGRVRRPSAAARGAGGAVLPAARELRHRLAGLLSGGERQMLAIAAALVSQAASCCWWTSCRSGLAPVVVDDLMARLLQIRSELRHHDRCWSSRARPWRSMSPTTATSWRTAASCSTATARACAAIPTSRSSIWASRERQAPQLPRRQAIPPQPEVVWLSWRSRT